jgi:hypothetical protein
MKIPWPTGTSQAYLESLLIAAKNERKKSVWKEFTCELTTNTFSQKKCTQRKRFEFKDPCCKKRKMREQFIKINCEGDSQSKRHFLLWFRSYTDSLSCSSWSFCILCNLSRLQWPFVSVSLESSQIRLSSQTKCSNCFDPSIRSSSNSSLPLPFSFELSLERSIPSI